MDVRQSYNLWAHQYDTNQNKTRDLEGRALREMLGDISFTTCLEIGCGTGKNTGWLAASALQVLAVDLSEEMLQKAKSKVRSAKVRFQQADINQAWDFADRQFDLVSFSLVLEHIQDLDEVFRRAAAATVSGGYVYVGELHPYKQYAGTRARFDTAAGQHVVSCFTHHLSDFTRAAQMAGLGVVDLNEYFDGHDRSGMPRILAILFKKQGAEMAWE